METRCEGDTWAMTVPEFIEHLRSIDPKTVLDDERAADLIERLTRVELWAKRVCRHKGYGGYDLQAAYGGLEKALLYSEKSRQCGLRDDCIRGDGHEGPCMNWQESTA